MYVGNVRQHRHGLDRQIEIRRPTRQPIAIKALRSDSHHGHGFGIPPESAAHHRGIARIVPLPRLITHHRRHRSARGIVGICDQASHPWLKPECAEVVSGNKLAHHRLGLSLGPIAPRRDRPESEAGLHGRQLLKLWCVLLQQFVGFGWNERVVTVLMDSPTHAAIVVVAQPHQRPRIGDGQALQQHRVHQREDCAVRPDAQRQC